ncbi:MAG TPA: hypothetical protein PKH39_18720 [Woeseiaceae bacterium]|nr:hypothetical protein [Woeseiaceae bacterium]
MECFLQYLDDLDDLYGMAGLIVERVRRFAILTITCLLLASGAAVGVWFAAVHPPMAVASSILLFVALLYRSVTSAHRLRDA